MEKNKKLIMISFMSIVIFAMYNSVFDTQIKELENTANTKAVLVNEHIRLSRSFIEQMTTYGNDYLKQSDIKDSELLNLLKYNPEQNTYNLDKAVDFKNIDAGNLTGIGKIPESDINRDEVNLAFEYNEYFSNFFNLLPDVAWLYYTSENNFINMYPWISSKDFSYSKKLKTVEFYKYVNPENNPLRKFLWTPVYMDHAGKGLMVTLSSPIYYNDTFKGVVSVDLTTDKLSEIIKSEYEMFLIDNNDSLLAYNDNANFDKKVVIKLGNVVNLSQSDINNIKQLNDNSVEKIGNYYVYSIGFDDAPWKIITIMHERVIIGKCLKFILPIIIICILLIFSINEVDNRKKTEILLENSLKELKSYQKMLENAAKYDFLTDTYNRRGLKEIIDRNLSIKIRDNEYFSLIMCDVDYFKNINDTYGHAAGDKVLVEISKIMKKIIKDDGVICRWGGEEFLIILVKNCDEAVVVAEDIRNTIENSVILWENSIELKTTMTLGVVQYSNINDFEGNILNVDRALYDGKRNGRNQVTVL